MPVILKKKFGQNFLIDNNILNKISKLIDRENINILEIGPGDGKLTDKIIQKKPTKLTLVEVDKDLIKILREKYFNLQNVEIINLDILKYNLKDDYDLVISNLPYNISSQVLVNLSSREIVPNYMILMFQKEFAKRLLEDKLNSLNSLIKCVYDIKLCFNVTRNCFYPIPKVDSSVLTFKKKNKSLLSYNEIENFILFKQKLFSFKRKTLKNILKKYDLNEKFNLNSRVEDLKLKELIKIFKTINS